MQACCSARLLRIFCTALSAGCSQDRPYPGTAGDRADGRLHDDPACAGSSIERDLVIAVIPLRLAAQERDAGCRGRAGGPGMTKPNLPTAAALGVLVIATFHVRAAARCPDHAPFMPTPV